LLQIFSIVGWVEVTKPFDYAQGKPNTQSFGLLGVALSACPALRLRGPWAKSKGRDRVVEG